MSQEKQTKKADLHHQLAISFMQKCLYPKAMAELRKALALKPKDPTLHHSIALLYFQFKKYDKTIKHLRTALKLKPEFTGARVHLGRALIEVQKIKLAIQELKKAQEDLTYPRTERIHSYLGLAYYKSQNFKESEKHFEVARTVIAEECTSALYHAKSLYFSNQFQKALNILEPAKLWCEKDVPVCSDPSFEPYFFSGLSYNKLHNRSKALSNIQIFLSKAKKSEYIEKANQYLKLWKAWL